MERDVNKDMQISGSRWRWVLVLWLVTGLFALTACEDGGAGAGGASVKYPRIGFSANAGDNTLSVYLVNAASGQWLHSGYVPVGDTPVAVAVTPDENFVYVVNGVDETVSGYGVDSTTTRLTAAGSIATGAGPASVAVSRNSRFVYVANSSDGTLSGYSSHATTGALSDLGGSPFSTGIGGGPVALAMHPTLNFLYVANHDNDTVAAFSVDSTTGNLAALAGSPYSVGAGSGPRALTVDPQGRYLYVANETDHSVAVFSVHATTGVLTQVDQDAIAGGIQNKPAGDSPNGVAIHSGGRYLYASNAGDDTLSAYTVDLATGLLTSAGAPQPTVADPRALRADPSGNFLFVASETGQFVTGYRIDSANGALTALAVTRTRNQPVALEFSSANGKLVPQTAHAYAVNAFSSELRVYAANASTGVLSWLSSQGSGNGPVAVAVDPFARFAYVVNNTDDSLSGYSINGTTGALTRLDLVPAGAAVDLATGTDPQQVTVDPSGRFLYVSATTAGVNGAVHGYTIDPTTGALTAIGGTPLATGATPKQLAVDPTGQYLYVVNNNSGGTGSVSAYSIHPVTGALTSLGAAVNTGTSPAALVVDPSARFAYVGNGGTNTLTRYILALDGTVSSPGSTTTQTGPLTLAADPLARFLYAGASTAVIERFGINGTSGALSSLGTTSLTPTPAALQADPSGRFLYVGYSNDTVITAFTISAVNGSLTSAGSVDNIGTAQSLALTRKLTSSGVSSGLWQ